MGSPSPGGLARARACAREEFGRGACVEEYESLEEATRAAVRAAEWVTDADSGLVAALLRCSQQIDDAVMDAAPPRELRDLMGVYLRYSESLGLSARVRAVWEKRERRAGGESSLSKLRRGAAHLRAV